MTNWVTRQQWGPAEVVADRHRILADIDKVRRVCGDPATRIGLARNADTVSAAIALIEGTT